MDLQTTPAMRETRLIFITGTDTGVGKTTLTALLLAHLRSQQISALAIKPFCSGSRDDVTLLRSLQDNELTPDEINPVFFNEPLAPFAAARLHRRRIPLRHVLEHIRLIARRCDCLVIEGVGGLLVPLTSNYSVLDLITRLRCEVLIVGRNRLGTLNHTLLTIRALRSASSSGLKPGKGGENIKVVLMQPRHPDASSASNPRVLAELLKPTPVVLLPFLGQRCNTAKDLGKLARALKRRLGLLAKP